MHPVALAVAIGIELGLDPEGLADPLRRVGEAGHHLGLTADEDRDRLAALLGGGVGGEGEREGAEQGSATESGARDHGVTWRNVGREWGVGREIQRK